MLNRGVGGKKNGHDGSGARRARGDVVSTHLSAVSIDQGDRVVFDPSLEMAVKQSSLQRRAGISVIFRPRQ